MSRVQPGLKFPRRQSPIPDARGTSVMDVWVEDTHSRGKGALGAQGVGAGAAAAGGPWAQAGAAGRWWGGTGELAGRGGAGMSLAVRPAAAVSRMQLCAPAPDVCMWAQAASSCAGWVSQPGLSLFAVTLLGIPDNRALVVPCSASLSKEKYSSGVSSIAVVEGKYVCVALFFWEF